MNHQPERQQKFERWVDAHTRSVHHTLRALGLDDEQAKEATQETFFQVWRSLPTFEGRSNERTWILGIASNVGLKHLRKQRRFFSLKRAFGFANEQLPSTSNPTQTPDALFAQKRTHKWIRQNIEQWTERRKQVFVLFHFEEQSIEEISLALSIPVGTVRSNLQRAREELQKRWSQLQRNQAETTS